MGFQNYQRGSLLNYEKTNKPWSSKLKLIAKRIRARDLGLPFQGQTGAHNSITDVSDIKVGFTTLNDPQKNIRTGVTAIIPRDD